MLPPAASGTSVRTGRSGYAFPEPVEAGCACIEVTAVAATTPKKYIYLFVFIEIFKTIHLGENISENIEDRTC
jgi:hypothetical protein